MKTVKELLLLIKDSSENSAYTYDLGYSFPYLYLVIQGDVFTDKEPEDQEEIFCRLLNLEISEYRRLLNNGMIMVRYSGSKEHFDKREFGFNWLPGLAESELASDRNEEDESEESPEFYPEDSGENRIIHFYGYKGGQARSTILGMLARNLATAGWRVLTVDADFEAPSLDILFGNRVSRIEGTLLGLHLGFPWATERVFLSPDQTKPGFVDLLPCRPASEDWEIEYSAFIIKSSSDPRVIENLADIITEKSKENYDIILIDHRSGLSSTPLFWMTKMKGPTVAVTRLDKQWLSGKNFFASVFSQYPNLPGIIVSFRTDSDDSVATFYKRNRDQVEDLLELISPTDSDVLLDSRFIQWPYDPSFKTNLLPYQEQISNDLKNSLYSIQSELSLTDEKISNEDTALRKSLSGAQDERMLIHTEHLRKLLSPSTELTYILGRKGTGKTRLYRELAHRNLGIPLLAAADSNLEQGINADRGEIQEYSRFFTDNPIDFWWSLILAGIISVKEGKKSKEDTLSTWKEEIAKHKASNTSFSESVRHIAPALSGKIVFLIDGVETAFSSSVIQIYTEALFRVISSIQNDNRINGFFDIKLFIRLDLVSYAGENKEQQMSGRSITLHWDTRSIMNFLVSRIYSESWFQEKFPDAAKNIAAHIDQIRHGELLDIQDCESLLLQIFPKKIGKLKLNFITFVKNYFSDATGTRDNEEGLAYYPRVYEYFLDFIVHTDKIQPRYISGVQIEKERVSQVLLIAAHEAASAAYFDEVKSELNHIIKMDDNSNDNIEKISSLIEALNGETTPFMPDELKKNLVIKLKIYKIKEKAIQEALHAMKRIGIFEDRPKDPGRWRVGKLFKHSLKMKFSRFRKGQE